MTKWFAIILFVGLIFESTGIVLLKKGLDVVAHPRAYNAAEIYRVVRAGVTNPQILLGVFFEAVFFGCLLVLMSRSEISFLWPLTALTFVFATFAAILFLHERVSPVRWIGVVLIMIGAGFISYSEHPRQKPPTPPGQATGVNQ
ncbi:MAG: EamA family transporter [Verrucomicrobia bacterium]|nr:EamA family transporter [Verrucomicrobiota bacterium]MDE3097904.1 EamA family transporter [Verrucomicrobiota bacterium]